MKEGKKGEELKEGVNKQGKRRKKQGSVEESTKGREDERRKEGVPIKHTDNKKRKKKSIKERKKPQLINKQQLKSPSA